MSDHDALPKVEMTFKTGWGKDKEEWYVRRFWMRERLGHPYKGAVDIYCLERDVDFTELLGRNCVLELSRGDDRRRSFQGMVFKVKRLGTEAGVAIASIYVAAGVYALSIGKTTRIFEDMTAPEIIEKVLKQGLQPFERTMRLQFAEKYVRREYTVQYDESDLDFVQRLMIEEGLTFYFDQRGETEILVLVDSNDCQVEIETMKKAVADGSAPGVLAPRQRNRTLRLRLVAGETKRGGKPYIIKFDNEPERKGQTTSDGLLVEKVPPGAQSARVRLEASYLGTDELVVNLDTLRDTTSLGGVQQRLCNAGFMSRATGSLNDETREALSRFQLRHGLKVTGELNEETRAKLEEEHGS